MTGGPRFAAWAVTSLVIAQVAFVGVVLGRGGPVLVATAAIGALSSLVLALIWTRRKQLQTLLIATVVGSTTALLPLGAPIPLSARILLAVGVVGVVGFFEFGHLSCRFHSSTVELDPEVQRASGRRLALVLAAVALVMAASMLGPLVASVVVVPTFARSLEATGALGVVYVGVITCLAILAVARLNGVRRRRVGD